MDASTNGFDFGLPGIGGFNFENNESFKSTVPPEFCGWRIEDLELLAHLICARLWASDWSGRSISGLTDSEPIDRVPPQEWKVEISPQVGNVKNLLLHAVRLELQVEAGPHPV